MTCEEIIKSQEIRELLLDYQVQEPGSLPGREDYCIVPVDNGISIFYFRPQAEGQVSLASYPYYALPKCYGLMQQEMGTAPREFDPLALTEAGIVQMQGAPLSLTGRGVVLGFIDTGIRYTQDVFRDAYGESRILAIWDQTGDGGGMPAGFLYGTEYKKEQIDRALAAPVPREIVPSWDEDGHGTAMASVAAGSIVDGGRTFRGAAPEADIVVVKLRGAKQYLRDYYLLPETAAAYAESDIMMAVKYLEQYAVALERPVVICLGIGTSYGSHTGSSLLDRYLNTVAGRRSRAIVVCGGSEGGTGHHFQGSSSQGLQNVELRVGENEKGFLLETWVIGPGRLQMSLRTPGGETVETIDGRRQGSEEYRFILDRTVVTANSIRVEEASGMSLLLLRFLNPTAGIWTLTVEIGELSVSGIGYHMWLPIEAFLSSDTRFLKPEPHITLTEPSMAQQVITVNAYNDADGSFYERSGRGFTADQRIKPEFVAPGVEIPTSLGRRTGSSLAAAVSAGAVAQMMQWAVAEGNYPFATGREIKYYLSLGAVRESGITYPSREWGLGKINVQRTFQELAGLF